MKLRFIALIAIVAALIIAGVWFFASGSSDNAVGAGGLPLIKADTNPVKLPPDEPGGEIMPNADSTVFPAMGSNEEQDPSMENLKLPEVPKPDEAALGPDFAGLKTGFTVPVAPEKKIESLFDSAPATISPAPLAIEPMERPAAEAAAQVVATAQTPIKAPEPVKPEAAAPAAEPVVAPVTEPVVPTPAPIANVVPAAQAQEAQEKAAVETTDAPAVTPPVPVSKPKPETKTAQAKPAQAKPADVKAPEKTPAKTEAQTVAEDIANEAFKPSSPATTTAPASGKYYMQLASTPSKEEAPKLWTRLQGKYPGALSGMSPAYQTATVPGKGEYIRVQAGPMTKDQAEDRCKKLRSVDPKGGCLVFRR